METPYYQAPVGWKGRIDGDTPETQRWHQRVEPVDLFRERLPMLLPGQKGMVFLGFACDEGVRRNRGRIGAEDGPDAMRQVMASFAVHFGPNNLLVDGGDIICEDRRLERAQEVLSEAVQLIKQAGYLPLVAGGGHDEDVIADVLTYVGGNARRNNNADGRFKTVGC